MFCSVRNARLSDLPHLTAIKPIETLHWDRVILALADPAHFRYVVLEVDGVVAGFVCLLLGFPQGWPTAGDAHLPFPRIIDLFIDPERRGGGLGTMFLARIEAYAAEAGAHALHLSVDAAENLRAQKLYRRNGFRDLGDPVTTQWNFQDSAGQWHCGRAELQEMIKLLAPRTTVAALTLLGEERIDDCDDLAA